MPNCGPGCGSDLVGIDGIPAGGQLSPPMAQVLVCDQCRHRIPFDDGQWPDSCPGCGRDTSLPDDDVIALPAFISPRMAATDKVYRDMERGSETRAQAAADMLGESASDMSALKITDLNDRRDAEIAAPSVHNEVTKVMGQAPVAGKGQPWGFSGDGAGYSGAVSSGPYANAGAKMLTNIRQAHGEATNWRATGDLPAREIFNPGYRRRA